MIPKQDRKLVFNSIQKALDKFEKEIDGYLYAYDARFTIFVLGKDGSLLETVEIDTRETK